MTKYTEKSKKWINPVYWQFNRKYCTEDVKRFVLVAGRGYIAADRNLEVIELSLCGGNGKNARGRVRDRPEKLISIFTTRVKRWNLGIAQCENTWHANGNRIDNTDGSTLYSFQTFTSSLGKTVMPNHWTVLQHWADDR